MAVFGVALGVSQDAGEESDYGVGHHEGWEFAASEDVVADGVGTVGDLSSYSLVNPFIVATDEDDVLLGSEFASGRLGEGGAHWVGKDDGGLVRL